MHIYSFHIKWIVSMTPYFIQFWWLTDLPLVSNKSEERVWAIHSRRWTPQGQSCHTPQEQPDPAAAGDSPRKRIGEGEKGQRVPATRHDSKKRLPAHPRCQPQCGMGHQSCLDSRLTSFSPAGHGSLGARAEMGKDQITPHRKAMSMSFALSLGKKINLGQNICCSSGFLMARV